jgi:broad specificity phosphatase PhoE
MRLILVRHGQTTSNLGGLLDTAEPGADLTDLGRRQAAALPAALGDEQIGAVYASTLVRTQQTAAPLALSLGLGIQVRAGLREVGAGNLEMLGDSPSLHTYISTFLTWTDGDPDLRMPGGESGTEFYARFDEVVAEVAGSGVGTAALVSHGAAIRSWTAARAENITTEHVAANPVTNTGAVILEGSPTAGWYAVTWEGHALGGPDVDAPRGDGPAGEPVSLA